MKKSNTFKIVALLIGMLVAGFAQAADNYIEVADASSALRIYSSEDATINITSAGAGADNTVIFGTTTNTIDGSGAIDTIAEFAAALAACTNAAGETPLTVDADCALAADSTDGELLTAAITVTAGVWAEINWDTSVALHYDVYIPKSSLANTDVYRGNLAIGTIYGNPVGTGAVTLSVYLDGSLAWQKLMPEVYAYSNNTASVELPVDVGLNAFGKAVIVRAARATTATTGNIGTTVDRQ